MWCTVDIVKYVKPKYIIWENVKNLLSKSHIHNFNSYIEVMAKLGYTSFYKILNAKDYGIPQNRERVYTISIRNDILEDRNKIFTFPEPRELNLRLKDMLVNKECVPEKYYINKSFLLSKTSHTTDSKIKVVGKLDIKGHDCVKRVYSIEGIAPTLTTMMGGNREPKILSYINRKYYEFIMSHDYFPKMFNPYNCAEIKDIAPTTACGSTTSSATVCIGVAMRGRYNKSGKTEQKIELNNKELSNAITTIQKDSLIGECEDKDIIRIRKLIPIECWRLQGFSDTDFHKAQGAGISDTQLYRQAGNSICVPVLEAIFKNIFEF